MQERDELLGRLRQAGVGERELERAAREQRLPTLAVELALGGRGRYTLTELAREGRVSTAFAREAMQALGRPNPAPRQRVFTEDDMEFARFARQLIDAGMPRRELLEVGRVMSEGMSRTADAVRRLVGNAMLEPGASEYTIGLRYAWAAEALGPRVPWLLDYQFRTHMLAGIRRQLVTEAELERGRLADTWDVAVAFADLVEYTKLGERLAPEDLGSIARRLAALAAAASKRPVQLVKTIGDAVMLVSPEPVAMVASVEGLLDKVAAEGEDFPRLRVGVSYGPATSRGGDWFGSTVNVASRVTDVAKADQVLVTEMLSTRVGDRSWKRRRFRRSLKGIDKRVRLFELVRSG